MRAVRFRQPPVKPPWPPQDLRVVVPAVTVRPVQAQGLLGELSRRVVSRRATFRMQYELSVIEAKKKECRPLEQEYRSVLSEIRDLKAARRRCVARIAGLMDGVDIEKMVRAGAKGPESWRIDRTEPINVEIDAIDMALGRLYPRAEELRVPLKRLQAEIRELRRGLLRA